MWETAVLQLFNLTNKCAASTQTDDVEKGGGNDETNFTRTRNSVGTESVPQRTARPKYLRKSASYYVWLNFIFTRTTATRLSHTLELFD